MINFEEPDMQENWQKPKLVIVVRNQPGETLLQGCKINLVQGAEDSNNGCLTETDCLACNVNIGS